MTFLIKKLIKAVAVGGVLASTLVATVLLRDNAENSISKK